MNQSSQRAALSIETEAVECDGRRVTYATFGDPGGVPVVALHGLPGSRAFGAFFDEAARERGVRVLAPDRPGVGGSERVDDWCVADAAAFVSGFLDALDVDASGVLGFSAGGPCALACAARIPERLTGTALLASPAPPAADVAESTMTRVVGGLARHTSLGLSLATRFQAAMLARQDPDALVSLLTTACEDDDAAEHGADDGESAFGGGAHAPESSVCEDVYEGASVADVVALDADLALAQGHGALASENRALATDWGVDPATVGARVDVFHGHDDENVPIAAANHYEHVLPNPRLHRHGVDHLELVLEHGGAALDAATGR